MLCTCYLARGLYRSSSQYVQRTTVVPLLHYWTLPAVRQNQLNAGHVAVFRSTAEACLLRAPATWESFSTANWRYLRTSWHSVSVRPYVIPSETAKTVAAAFISSRLDYCNQWYFTPPNTPQFWNYTPTVSAPRPNSSTKFGNHAWNLVLWFSGTSLNMLSPDVRF